MVNYSPPPFQGLQILYLDEYLLVVDKPSNLLTVPGKGPEKYDSLIVRVQTQFPQALIVHRLDLGTSGAIILALDKVTQAKLGMMFEKRKLEKRYEAMVHGQLQQDSGSIELPLITDWPNRPRQKVDFDLGKPSLTEYRLISFDARSDTSRVELLPKTGRSHQLRVHLQALGHPILGDELYASDDILAMSDRLMLHAQRLGFRHPLTHEYLTIDSPMPF